LEICCRSDNFCGMKTSKLNYDLPAELIAQVPSKVRSESRLLVLDRNFGSVTDTRFDKIGDYLKSGDCLVINDTKVLPARFYAKRLTGGRLEGLYLEQNDRGNWKVMLKGLRKIKIGETIELMDNQDQNISPYKAKFLDKTPEGNCLLQILSDDDAVTVLDKIGFPPLPPYIKRDADADSARFDRERYQTVYAQSAGAVAAPTAGLHFTDELIKNLESKGVNFASVTLHVGAGTFKPVTVEDLEDHRIHSEFYHISGDNAERINHARFGGNRIIAVGTTSVRTLETAVDDNIIKTCSGQTNLFIKPGYQFKIVDSMITNFHLPGSTLLALVAAFAGLDKTLDAYKHAIEEQYRFYSYGDAMMIL